MRLKAVGTILPSTPSAGRSGEQERSTAHGALPATFEGVDAAQMVVGVARYELGVFDLLFLPAETTGGGGVAKHDALSTGGRPAVVLDGQDGAAGDDVRRQRRQVPLPRRLVLPFGGHRARVRLARAFLSPSALSCCYLVMK